MSTDSTSKPLARAPQRIGLVGARRARQCLGPFLARFAEMEGAFVPAFAGASERYLGATEDALARFLGHEVRGYIGTAALIAGEAERGAPLHALIIATPIEAHREGLEAALAAGVPVLCEKPLLWHGPGSASAARSIVENFETRQLGLQINAQWPFTLPTYQRLFPDLDLKRATRFHMRLSPAATGADMLPDAMPHALSLLQAVAPAKEPAIRNPVVEFVAADGTSLLVSFTWCAPDRDIAARVELIQHLEQPRPAAFGFDDRIAQRTIRLPEYQLALEAEGRRVDLPDPMQLLVKEFCRTLGLEGRMPRLEVQRLLVLESVMGVISRGTAPVVPPVERTRSDGADS